MKNHKVYSGVLQWHCHVDAGVNSCVLLRFHSFLPGSQENTSKTMVSFSSKRSHTSLAGCLLLVKRIAVPFSPRLILESRIETMKFCAATAELTPLQIAE
eukprot:s3896_g4.t1